MRALVYLLFLTGCGQSAPEKRAPIDLSRPAEAWNANNDPLNLRDAYEVELASLPRSGETTHKPWTDTYWPNHRGGIAARWNDPSNPDPFTYETTTPSALSTMTELQLSRLSPAEKYDAFMGRYEYPLIAYERERTSPDDPGWFGLCHGWAPAALNYAEPKPVVVQGAGGVKMPFGSSDVKALLLYAQQFARGTRYAGERCNEDSGGADGPECKDINAGSFHVILANQIGLLGQGFVAEVNRGAEVWNHPVFGFDARILDTTRDVYEGAAPGTVEIARVRTTMRYVVEDGPTWEPMPMAEYPSQVTRQIYEYTLELNAAGEVIGGEWSSMAHPDFVWTQKPFKWEGYFAGVKTIYEAATR